MTDNEKVVQALQTQMHSLKTTVDEQTTQIQQLQAGLNDSEQYSRRSNMEVHGLPSSPLENLSSWVGDLAHKLAIPDFHPSSVVAVHRLPTRGNKAPPVLIRFASVRVRDAWMAAKGRLRSLIAEKSVPQLFFNENLTRANSELFWKARTRAKERHFRFVWLKNGRIFAKREEGAPIVRIAQPNDLEKMI